MQGSGKATSTASERSSEGGEGGRRGEREGGGSGGRDGLGEVGRDGVCSRILVKGIVKAPGKGEGERH